MLNKDRALREWADACPLMMDSVLLNFLRESEGSAAVIPTGGREKTCVDGSIEGEYGFELRIMRRVSDNDDDVNADSLEALWEWRGWVDAQEKAGNYPDFGCSDYRMRNAGAGPRMAYIYESGMAVYSAAVTLSYFDERGNS